MVIAMGAIFLVALLDVNYEILEMRKEAQQIEEDSYKEPKYKFYGFEEEDDHTSKITTGNNRTHSDRIK